MPKRKRAKGKGTKAKKNARIASHIMKCKAQTMDDVLVNLGMPFFAVGWENLAVMTLMLFNKSHTDEVAEFVQQTPDCPPEHHHCLRRVPKPIWRAFCAGH